MTDPGQEDENPAGAVSRRLLIRTEVLNQTLGKWVRVIDLLLEQLPNLLDLVARGRRDFLDQGPNRRQNLAFSCSDLGRELLLRLVWNRLQGLFDPIEQAVDLTPDEIQVLSCPDAR